MNDDRNARDENQEEAQVTWHDHQVSRAARESLNGHRGSVLWFTGLSGSGKSTIANLVDHKLHNQGVHTFVLDGDNVRMGLNASIGLLREAHSETFAQRFGLAFSAEDREENIRRIGAVSQLFCSAGLVTLVAFVSPYRSDRDSVRRRLGDDFVEVFVDTPLEECERRDPKGLYKKARSGEIQGFTGIDAPYEPPEQAELRLSSGGGNAEMLAEEVVEYLRVTGRIG